MIYSWTWCVDGLWATSVGWRWRWMRGRRKKTVTSRKTYSANVPAPNICVPVFIFFFLLAWLICCCCCCCCCGGREMKEPGNKDVRPEFSSGNGNWLPDLSLPGDICSPTGLYCGSGHIHWDNSSGIQYAACYSELPWPWVNIRLIWELLVRFTALYSPCRCVFRAEYDRTISAVQLSIPKHCSATEQETRNHARILW